MEGTAQGEKVKKKKKKERLTQKQKKTTTRFAGQAGSCSIEMCVRMTGVGRQAGRQRNGRGSERPTNRMRRLCTTRAETPTELASQTPSNYNNVPVN